MKQNTTRIRVALFAMFMTLIALPSVAQSFVAGSGDIIGQEESQGIGVFNGSEEWSALGKAPFPLPNGASALFQHDLRANTSGFKFDSEISFGDVISTNLLAEVYAKFGPSRFDISYFQQNQLTSPPTVQKIDIVTITPAFNQNPF